MEFAWRRGWKLAVITGLFWAMANPLVAEPTEAQFAVLKEAKAWAKQLYAEAKEAALDGEEVVIHINHIEGQQMDFKLRAALQWLRRPLSCLLPGYP